VRPNAYNEKATVLPIKKVPVVYRRQNILTTGTVLLKIFALYILIFCIEVNEKKSVGCFLVCKQHSGKYF